MERSDRHLKEEVLDLLIPKEQQPDPRIPALRRLHLEAFSEMAGELKRRAEGPSNEVSKRMCAPEREARRQAVMSKLPSQKFKRHEEPGYGLVDLTMHMWETKIIQHIPLIWCPSREQELVETLPGKTWQPASEANVDVGGPRKLQQAYRRRGFALEEAGMMSFEAHDVLVDKFMRAYTEPAVDSRYASASYKQIINADKYIFKELLRKCRNYFREWQGSCPWRLL